MSPKLEGSKLFSSAELNELLLKGGVQSSERPLERERSALPPTITVNEESENSSDEGSESSSDEAPIGIQRTTAVSSGRMARPFGQPPSSPLLASTQTSGSPSRTSVRCHALSNLTLITTPQSMATSSAGNSPRAGPLIPPVSAALMDRQIHAAMEDLAQLSMLYSSKCYMSGFVFKINELGENGRPARDGMVWTKYWAELSGPILSLWNVPVELASRAYVPKMTAESVLKYECDEPDTITVARIKAKGKPEVIPMANSVVELLAYGYAPISAHPRASSMPPLPYDSFLAVSSSGSNVIHMALRSSIACNSWAGAMRLSAYEGSRISEHQTLRLLKKSSLQPAWAEFDVKPFKTSFGPGLGSRDVQWDGRVKVLLQYSNVWVERYVVVSCKGEGKSLSKDGSFRKLLAVVSRKKAEEKLGIPDSASVKPRAQISFYASKADWKSSPSSPLFRLENVRHAYMDLLIEQGTSTPPNCIKIEGSFVLPEVKAATVENEPRSLSAPGRGFSAADPLPDLVAGHDLRPSPQHVHIAASGGTIEMARWIVATFAAFGLDSDLQSRDSEISDGLVGLSNGDWGKLYLSPDDIAGLPMSPETLGDVKLRFAKVLNDKAGARRSGFLQQWNHAVDQGKAAREEYEQQEIRKKIDSVMTWIERQNAESPDALGSMSRRALGKLKPAEQSFIPDSVRIAPPSTGSGGNIFCSLLVAKACPAALALSSIEVPIPMPESESVFAPEIGVRSDSYSIRDARSVEVAAADRPASTYSRASGGVPLKDSDAHSVAIPSIESGKSADIHRLEASEDAPTGTLENADGSPPSHAVSRTPPMAAPQSSPFATYEKTDLVLLAVPSLEENGQWLWKYRFAKKDTFELTSGASVIATAPKLDSDVSDDEKDEDSSQDGSGTDESDGFDNSPDGTEENIISTQTDNPTKVPSAAFPPPHNIPILPSFTAESVAALGISPLFQIQNAGRPPLAAELPSVKPTPGKLKATPKKADEDSEIGSVSDESSGEDGYGDGGPSPSGQPEPLQGILMQNLISAQMVPGMIPSIPLAIQPVTTTSTDDVPEDTEVAVKGPVKGKLQLFAENSLLSKIPDKLPGTHQMERAVIPRSGPLVQLDADTVEEQERALNSRQFSRDMQKIGLGAKNDGEGAAPDFMTAAAAELVANAAKKKFQGGLLGEMERVEREKEILKRTGQYQPGLQVPGVGIPPVMTLPPGAGPPQVMWPSGYPMMSGYPFAPPPPMPNLMNLPPGHYPGFPYGYPMTPFSYGVPSGYMGAPLQQSHPPSLGVPAQIRPFGLHPPSTPMNMMYAQSEVFDSPADTSLDLRQHMMREAWLESERQKEVNRLLERGEHGPMTPLVKKMSAKSAAKAKRRAKKGLESSGTESGSDDDESSSGDEDAAAQNPDEDQQPLIKRRKAGNGGAVDNDWSGTESSEDDSADLGHADEDDRAIGQRLPRGSIPSLTVPIGATVAGSSYATSALGGAPALGPASTLPSHSQYPTQAMIQGMAAYGYPGYAASSAGGSMVGRELLGERRRPTTNLPLRANNSDDDEEEDIQTRLARERAEKEELAAEERRRLRRRGIQADSPPPPQVSTEALVGSVSANSTPLITPPEPIDDVSSVDSASTTESERIRIRKERRRREKAEARAREAAKKKT